MKTLRLLFLLCFSGLFTPIAAQSSLPTACPFPPPPGASDCFSACVYCDINFYQGTNNGPYNGGLTVCGGITLHNPTWHAFVAGTSFIALEIIPSNCQYGDGLQVAILDDCTSLTALDCQTGGNGMGTAPMVVFYDNFTPGATYYLLIDGFIGDVCDYEIQVIQGTATPPVPSVPWTPSGPNLVCPGFLGNYSIPAVAGAGYYHWTAPPGSFINGAGNNVNLNHTEGTSVWIQFGQTSGQVCVAAGNACTPEGPVRCFNVTVQPIPPTILPPIVVPFDELPYLWEPNGIVISNPGVFNVSAVLTSVNGCDSLVRQQITVLSPNPGYITGILYWDADEDGFFDAGEQPFSNGAVMQTSSGQLTNTGSDGRFVFINIPAGDTIRVSSPLPGGLTATPEFRVVQSNIWNNYHFGISPAPSNFDLSIFLNTPVFRPGFSATITLTCRNTGPSVVQDVVVNASIPFNLLEFIFALPINADWTLNGNDLEWRVGNLSPGQFQTLSLQVKVPIQVPLGTLIAYQANVTPVDQDDFPTNNFDRRIATVVGSYDPNDKLVEPAYVTPGMLTNGLPFEYTIRFQNTGTYPAEFVRIIDSLGSMVDPGSFRFITASHPCTWKISDHGVVEFFFDNIQLPDSSSNEPESHGYVRFSVMPKRQLALGSVVENFCDIYFDFNPPIRTNTAGTQVVYFIPGTGLSVQDALIVRPNPAAFAAFCNWQTPAPADGRLRFFDVTGLPRVEVPISAGQDAVHIDVQSIPPGLYFVVLEAGDLLLNNKVIVARAGILGIN